MVVARKATFLTLLAVSLLLTAVASASSADESWCSEYDSDGDFEGGAVGGCSPENRGSWRLKSVARRSSRKKPNCTKSNIKS